MKLSLERADDLPLYRQIANQLREYIRTGALPVGGRLPTIRELAHQYGLTRLTVQSAYAELQAEGLVESGVGRGTFVADHLPIPTSSHTSPLPTLSPPSWLSQGILADMMRMTAHPDLLSFAQAIPEVSTYPTQELSRSLRSTLEDPASLSYSLTQGELSLREQVAHILLDRGIVTSPDLVMITSGAQQAIDLTLRAFISPEDIVLVEDPTYVGMIELAAQRGQRVIGIPSDEHGILPDAVEAACKRYHPRLLYLIPTFHNPTGRSLSSQRRQALLRLARTYDFLIFEDDVAGMLAYDDPSTPALKASDTDGHVIYATSFSKVLLPGVRIGMIVTEEKHLLALLAARRTSDLFSSPLLQHALADYLHRHHLSAHLQRVRPLYRARRDAMLSALQRHLPECSWTCPMGGLNLWVTFPEQINERDFYLQAIERGVGIAPGAAFFLQPQARAHMRLSFGAHTSERIEQGVALLGDLLHTQLRCLHRLTTRTGVTSSFL
ncbi:MAG: PLP-dependent aminotransferase family protein [Ktedonobacteraceae bacterium]|nr:PLP-dependent aminotransferase family protein [Ktedonobacteraceae bacterium]